MKFAGIQNLGVMAKGVRGLAYNQEFAGTIVGVLSPVIVNATIISIGFEVKAGAPTSFAVGLGAPANATVRKITAELTVNSGPSGATNLSAGVSVKEGGTTTSFDVGVAVAPPDGLQNVEIRLEGGDVLWTRPGVLAAGKYEIPDFTEQANAYLDKLPVSSGAATLNFLLKSDVEGRASVRLLAVEWSLIQTQAWTNELDATIKMDKSLELTFGDSRIVDLDPVTVPAGKTLKRQVLRLDAGGQFGPERLLGRIDTHAGDDFVLVIAGNSLAQRLRLDPAKVKAPLSCSGVAVRFAPPGAKEPAAEFYAELQPDQDGFPASGATRAKANVKLEPPAEREARPWLRATFEAPVELEPGALYWLVLKGVTGGGKVALRPTPAAAAADLVDCDRAAVNRGGKTWRLLPALRTGTRPPQALIALTYTPGLETQAAAVEIAVEGAASGVRLDPAGAVRTIELPLPDGDPSTVRLVVGAYAEGALTIANVIQEDPAHLAAHAMQPSQIKIFDGLRITTEHVDHLQGALHSALRDLRAIAGVGVHRGLQVTLGSDGVAVIAPGMAIDGAGNRLVCDDPLQAPIGVLAADEPRFVCLRYDRVENGEVEGRPTLVWDSCAAEVRSAAPAPEDNLVVLARVVGNAGGGPRIEPAVATMPVAEAEPRAAAGVLGVLQGVLRIDGAEADIVPRLTDAIRAQAVQGDPLVVPLQRRDVAVEAQVMSLSCRAVLSAAFTAPAAADIQPAGFRCHASASAEATFTGEAIAQWALSTTYDTDRGVSRPSLGDGLIASLEPALVAGAAESGSLPALLAPLELRARIEWLEADDGFAAACELVWSGETGEAAAIAVQAGLAAAHWEFSLAWKALVVSSTVAARPGS